MLNNLKIKLRALLRKSEMERELDDELRYHVERQTEQNVRLGMSPEEARDAARKVFGGVEQAKEQSRDYRGVRWLEEVWQDSRYGLRMLRKSPGRTAVMCATLALGIGLTTGIFSLAYSVLLRTLPYPAPERLVSLHNTSSIPMAAGSRLGVCSADWVDWRAQSRSFDDIALTRMVTNFNLTGNGPPERVLGARTTWNLLAILGVQPLLGRFFTKEEAGRDASVAVLSYGFWERRFASDPAIVGRKIQLNGVSFEVIGVTPQGFQYPTNEYDLWTPLMITTDEIQARMVFYYRAVGRLKSGVSIQQAQAEMNLIMRRLEEQY